MRSFKSWMLGNLDDALAVDPDFAAVVEAVEIFRPVYGRAFAAARTAGFLAETLGDMEFLPICFEISPCGLLDLEHPITVPLRCLDLADLLPMRFLPVSRDVRNAVEADIFGARAIAPIEERVPKRLSK